MTESRPLAGHATDPQCGPRDGAACRGLSASSIPGRGELTHRGPIFRSAVTIRGESPPERVNLLAEPAAIFMCRRGFDGGAARGGSLRRSWALLDCRFAYSTTSRTGRAIGNCGPVLGQ